VAEFREVLRTPRIRRTTEVSIYVDPATQRRGIASALMDRALERAPALGLSTFLGFVFAHNQQSVALCEKYGFARWGHLPRVASLDGIDRDLLILGRRV